VGGRPSHRSPKRRENNYLILNGRERERNYIDEGGERKGGGGWKILLLIQQKDARRKKSGEHKKPPPPGKTHTQGEILVAPSIQKKERGKSRGIP